MACDTMPCPTRWLGQRIFVRRADYRLDMRGDNANNKQEDEVKSKEALQGSDLPFSPPESQKARAGG